MNNVTLTGRLTFNPELRKTPQQQSVCTFTIAVDRRIGKKQSADFISIETWNKTAEFVCNYFKKGDGIEVIGSLATNQYKDSNGRNVLKTYVLANAVQFTLSNKKAPTTAENAPQSAEEEQPQDNSNDTQFEGFDTGTAEYVSPADLPF